MTSLWLIDITRGVCRATRAIQVRQARTSDTRMPEQFRPPLPTLEYDLVCDGCLTSPDVAHREDGHHGRYHDDDPLHDFGSGVVR
jgi:hypothetical protein